MLIRCSGYNDGAKEYLEQGMKSGRDYSRDELDERVVLDGDLDLTQAIYKSIPYNKQERYASFTLSFREDEISPEVLQSITQEFKSFMMAAYQPDEFNFYAEAHLPKVKTLKDKATGEEIERKPHIHIIIPRKNLTSGKEMNPRGMYESHERYFEAFQEHVNQKYGLASPREHIRIDPQNAADILSRYKGDDFRGKQREFKMSLVQRVVDESITTRAGFYALVAQSGEIKIRNEGKDNEYVAVKLSGDSKFTNLKETIFNDDFICRRVLSKSPLDKRIIEQRLNEWALRSREIKYVSKATPAFRQQYKAADSAERERLLLAREKTFYAKYGVSYGSLSSAERTGNHQSGTAQTENRDIADAGVGVQDLSASGVAGVRQRSKVLLPDDARLHLGNEKSHRATRLRRPVSPRRGRGVTRSVSAVSG